jgi:hypothetical protein
MAIILVNKHTMRTAAVYEDPRPQGNRLYLWQNQAVDEQTLAFYWNQGINHNTADNTIAGFGLPAMYSPGINDASWRGTGVLFLAGETVHVYHDNLGGVNNSSNNLDLTNFFSLDPSNPCRTHKNWIYGTDQCIFTHQNEWWTRAGTTTYAYQTRYNVTGELYNTPATKYQYPSYLSFYPIWMNPANGRIVGASLPGDNNGGGQHNWHISNVSNLFTGAGATTLAYNHVQSISYSQPQFIGAGSTGQFTFFRNDTVGDFTQTFYRYDDVNNSMTTLATFNTAPTAAGTHRGGDRSTNHGTHIPKFSSKTFPDPLTTSTTRAWYTPYVDSTGTFHPFYFQWNRINDTFTRSSDITMVWPTTGTNQSTYLQLDNVSAANNNTSYPYERMWYNETFTVAENNTTTRFLTFYQLSGSSTGYNNDTKLRTFLTFVISTATMKTLTFHSAVTIPETPKNFLYLNDAETSMAVISLNNTYVYNFRTTDGWTLTQTLPFRYGAVGRDALGRVWAVDPGPQGFGRLHIFTPSTPSQATVSFAQPFYNYTGTVINSTVSVDALTITGDRVSSNVTLRAEGTSIRFDSSGTNVSSIIVATSSTTSTVVPIRIVGPGQTNIVTSVNI